MKKALLILFTCLSFLTTIAQVPSDQLNRIEENGKFGYADFSENIIIPAIYDDAAYNFHKCLAYVQKSGKYGFIDSSGAAVIPFIYDELYITAELKLHFAIVRIGKNWGFINSLGVETIPIKYQVDEENKQMNFVLDGNSYLDENNYVILKLKDKYGAITLNDKIVIPFIYDRILSSGDYHWPTYILQLKKRWALADSSGKPVSDFKYTDHLDFWNKYAVMQYKGKWLFVDTKTMQEKTSIEDDNDVKEDLVCFQYKGKYGQLNRKGEVVVPFIYDRPISGNIFTVIDQKNPDDYKSYKKGILGAGGKEIMPAIYDDISSIYGGFYELEQNGKIGYADSNYKIIIPVEFDYGIGCGNFFIIGKGDKQTIYSLEGKQIIPFIYNTVHFCYGKYLAVSQNGKYGFIDVDGNVKIPLQYDGVLSGFLGEYVGVKKNGKIGFINTEGKTVVDFKYDEIDGTYNNFYQYDFVKLKRGEVWVNVNVDGKEF